MTCVSAAGGSMNRHEERAGHSLNIMDEVEVKWMVKSIKQHMPPAERSFLSSFDAVTCCNAKPLCLAESDDSMGQWHALGTHCTRA